MSDRIDTTKAVLAGPGPGTFWALEREIEVWNAPLAAQARIEKLERAAKKVRRMARLSEHDDQDTMESRLQGIEQIALAALAASELHPLAGEETP